ncbi:MAG: ion channel [Minisyncoccia bacterium]
MATSKKSFVDRLDTFSYNSIFLLWGLNLVFFAVVYALLSYSPGNGPAELAGYSSVVDRFFAGLYYSVITATNTGYGDILPVGFSRFFAALEAFLGLFLFALFMSKLVSRRQDVALRQMHKISFENSFHNIREDLHIIRDDFRQIISEAQAGESLTPRHTELLTVAYELCGNLLREVPLFYADDGDLYSIDAYRERLLLEAFHRTFVRLTEMLEFFDAQKIPWRKHEESVAHLREMLNDVDAIIPRWRIASAHDEVVVFEEILMLADAVRKLVLN